jgi:hypothetical protein
LIATALVSAAGHCTEAAADDASARSRYVTLNVDGDEVQNRQSSIELGMPIGQYGTLHGSYGQNEADYAGEDLTTDVASIGLGASGEHVEFAIDYLHRADDAAFVQNDVIASLGWRGTLGGVGVDVFSRNADDETVASIQRRRRDPRIIRLVESVDGVGYGAHGDFDVTPELNLFASAMTYDYDRDTNHPFLSARLFTVGSGLTRDQAFLDNTLGLGASYRFSLVSLTGQYFRDEALATSEITDTLELTAIILLGEHWSIAPRVGVSKDERDSVVFGGVGMGFNW